MTVAEKLSMLKTFLHLSSTTTYDTELTAYLTLAEAEIINWRYGDANSSKFVKAKYSGKNGWAQVNAIVFIHAISGITNGDYVFTYDADDGWQYNGADVDLEDYGITFDGANLTAGDTITITYNNRYLAQYDMVAIQACVVGYGISGAEGQLTHSENGISRSFEVSNMIDYIHKHVPPYLRMI
jgi:hypothetical protein